jgi:uncharacterized protein DUF417
MNLLNNALIKLGLLKEDLDYHLIRASMVVLFLFFGYQKWFEYEAQVLIPFISNGPLISWMYPRVRCPGSELVSRRVGVVVRPALVPGFLGQATGNSRRPRLLRVIHRNGHDHPLHAGWLGGVCRRVSGHDGQRAVPHEGREAGRRKSVSLGAAE